MKMTEVVATLRHPLYRQCLDDLLALPKFGRGVGLDRMAYLQAQLPDPAHWDSIKVTGSNGKGSTVAMVSAILHSLGLRHGSYISPHLFCFNERIAVDGKAIALDDLARSMVWAQTVLAQHRASFPEDQFGAFEVFTGMALHHFHEERVQHLVLEAGIGGRYDATRPIPGTLVGLTSLDLEHTELLGHSLEEIAFDKMDLCPRGGTLVINPLSDDAPHQQIHAYARERGLHLISVADLCSVTRLSFAEDGTRFDLEVGGLQISDLRLNLLGPRQVDNAMLAIVLVMEYLKRHQPSLSAAKLVSAVRHALGSVTWPGRAQKVYEQPPVYVDVGHTPQAVAAFVQALPGLLGEVPVLLVLGVSENKAVDAIVGQLASIALQVICTRAYHKGAAVDRIQAAVQRVAPSTPCHAAPRIEEAVELALRLGREQGMTTVVAGGLFLAVEFMMALAGGDPARLRFF